MRLHRYYISDEFKLKHDFWIHDRGLLNQWNKVLRYRSGQEVVLFDGVDTERLYRIIELKEDEAHLSLVTDFERQLPSKELYLFWSLLKKNKNDWVIQKATELGVSHFVPLLADRTEKTGFDIDRARKIIIESSEQCGRSDVPNIREPMQVATVLGSMRDKLPILVCDQGGNVPEVASTSSLGILVGPEGGWSDTEKGLFDEHNIPKLGLGQFTLRAETASIAASTLLMAD